MVPMNHVLRSSCASGLGTGGMTLFGRFHGESQLNRLCIHHDRGVLMFVHQYLIR